MVRTNIGSRKVPVRMFTVPVGAISGIYPRRIRPSITRRSTRPTPRTQNRINTVTAPIASPENSGSSSDSDSEPQPQPQPQPQPRNRTNTLTAPIASPDNSDSGSDSDSPLNTMITPVALPDNSNSGSGSKTQSQPRNPRTTLITPVTLSDSSDSDSLSPDEKEPTPKETAPPPPPTTTENLPDLTPAPSSSQSPSSSNPLEHSTEQGEAANAPQSVGEKRKRIKEENLQLQGQNGIQIQLDRMEKRQIKMSSDIAQMKDTLNSIVSLLVDQLPSR